MARQRRRCLHLYKGKRLIEAMNMPLPRKSQLLLVALIALCLRTPESAAQSTQPNPRTAKRFAFISDTQTPLLVEALFVGKDRNEEATDSLFASIMRLQPAALFMLGDLVSLGAYPGAWEKMDTYIQTVRAAHIPVHAVLGNHELMIYSRTGERYFTETFPDHRRTGYCVAVDSVAVVLLNSNFDRLEPNEKVAQQQWYVHALDSLTKDPGTNSIVVCCHHSPFTNSTIVEAAEDVRLRFVPPFIASPKCRLLLSGHAHTFERFKHQGKDFVVIGGGGGSRHTLFTGAEQLWVDLSPETKPLFHYIALERNRKSLVLTVWGLRRDFVGVEPGYAFRIGDE
jgi:hypothetical protein